MRKVAQTRHALDKRIWSGAPVHKQPALNLHGRGGTRRARARSRHGTRRKPVTVPRDLVLRRRKLMLSCASLLLQVARSTASYSARNSTCSAPLSFSLGLKAKASFLASKRVLSLSGVAFFGWAIGKCTPRHIVQDKFMYSSTTSILRSSRLLGPDPATLASERQRIVYPAHTASVHALPSLDVLPVSLRECAQ